MPTLVEEIAQSPIDFSPDLRELIVMDPVRMASAVLAFDLEEGRSRTIFCEIQAAVNSALDRAYFQDSEHSEEATSVGVSVAELFGGQKVLAAIMEVMALLRKTPAIVEWLEVVRADASGRRTVTSGSFLPVDIYPEDDQKCQIIMVWIRDEEIMVEREITDMVESVQFSSVAFQVYAAVQMVLLFRRGLFRPNSSRFSMPKIDMLHTVASTSY